MNCLKIFASQNFVNIIYFLKIDVDIGKSLLVNPLCVNFESSL